MKLNSKIIRSIFRLKLLLVLFLPACTHIVFLGGMTSAGLFMGYKHSKAGGMKECFNNAHVEKQANNLWKEANLDEPCLDVVSVQGIPVIIGAAGSNEGLEKAKSSLYAKFEKVQCLANMQIGYWNTSLALRIKLKLMFDWDISSRNYIIRAIKKHVWIVGVADNIQEKEKVIVKVESMDGVASVSHFILLDDANIHEDAIVIKEGETGR